MHFFKLFLAATFAVTASIKGLLTLLGSNLPTVEAAIRSAHQNAALSIAGGVASMISGALIAKLLRRRPVPKASRD